ncbi:hypothetical protein HHI36_011976 [Cryptolaemus montrouzieri]|uniref:Uncharacterized protein n=1 Tax=Cryptolaemus montrouzieri TaxID=559131 RepID=A0ABD2NDX3_9CUCU
MQRKLSSEIRNVLKVDVRFMEFFVLNLNEADLLLHLTTKTHANISMEYKGVKEKLEKLPDYIKVLSLAVVGYCLPDTTKQESLILHWGLAKIWDRIVPRELCLQDDGIPVMRTCQGDFVSGGSWSQPTGICAKDIKVPDLTKYLHQSLYTNITSNLIDNVTSITYNNSLSFLDIYFYSELIKKVNVSKDQNCTQNVFKIINNLSKMNQTELKTSQTLFNATDTILRLLDKEATTNFFKSNESYSFSDENILIQSVNPFKSNISGLYLLGTMQTPLNEMEVFFLFRNETIKDINPDRIKDLDIAVNVPEDVLKSIEADSGDQSGIQIIFTVFYEDSLFVSSNKKSAGKVVSVIIPGYGTYLNESIPIIVRSSINSKSQCGYWNFGQSLQRKKGEWSSFGGEYSGNFLNNSDLHLCHFSHLTHFALLIVSEHIKIEEGGQEITDFLIDENEWDSYLTIITLIGGALSVFGIIGIYLTAILFSEWRAKDGTQILLNLSTAILSEIIVLQFSGATEFLSNNNCKLVGCLLHYTLLSKLCWMLIYALLQYRRFVKVLGPTPKNLILHSMVFGWGFASIPVILTLIFAPESYTKSTICYLRGLPFYLAISLPVCLVIISNLTIFILVMYNVSTSNIESTTVDHKFSLLQLYLAILLFFVLGLPSVFAITADFVTDDMLKMILLFLFCATGTLQGFILFVFYVLFNDETKQKWRKYFKSNKM